MTTIYAATHDSLCEDEPAPRRFVDKSTKALSVSAYPLNSGERDELEYVVPLSGAGGKQTDI